MWNKLMCHLELYILCGRKNLPWNAQEKHHLVANDMNRALIMLASVQAKKIAACHIWHCSHRAAKYGVPGITNKLGLKNKFVVCRCPVKIPMFIHKSET